MHFHPMQQMCLLSDGKQVSEKKNNVHLVIQSSCVCKTVTKTNVNKENHTLDLTKIMQYGLVR